MKRRKGSNAQNKEKPSSEQSADTIAPMGSENQSATYSWQTESDEDFSAWILDENNREYLETLLKDIENEETVALRARVNETEDSETYRDVQLYLFSVENGEPLEETEGAVSSEPGADATVAPSEEPTEEPSLQPEEESEASKVIYPWDNMTDEEFAEWILCGDNDTYILRILTELIEEKKAQAQAEKAEKENSDVSVEGEQGNDSASSESSPAESEGEAFEERVEEVDDVTILEQIKSYLLSTSLKQKRGARVKNC